MIIKENNRVADVANNADFILNVLDKKFEKG